MADVIAVTSTRQGVNYGTVAGSAGATPTVIYPISGPILQLAATVALHGSAYLQVALSFFDPTLHPSTYFPLGEVSAVDLAVDAVTFKYDASGSSCINIALPDTPQDGTAFVKLSITGDGSADTDSIALYARIVAKQNVV